MPEDRRLSSADKKVLETLVVPLLALAVGVLWAPPRLEDAKGGTPLPFSYEDDVDDDEEDDDDVPEDDAVSALLPK